MYTIFIQSKENNLIKLIKHVIDALNTVLVMKSVFTPRLSISNELFHNRFIKTFIKTSGGGKNWNKIENGVLVWIMDFSPLKTQGYIRFYLQADKME